MATCNHVLPVTSVEDICETDLTFEKIDKLQKAINIGIFHL